MKGEVPWINWTSGKLKEISWCIKNLDEAMEDCEIDLWDMYHDYIEGKREIAEINMAFVEGE